jgi:site-specific DNA recombinase
MTGAVRTLEDERQLVAAAWLDMDFRTAYLRSVIDRIEVDDHAIRLIGDRITLEQAITGKSQSTADVRSFERKWRSLGDSNPCFRRERATS